MHVKKARNKSRNGSTKLKELIPTALAAEPSRTVRTSLAQRAYLDIRNKILKGELVVGAALSRRKLADELNISVPPVMEALQQLERDGLVESRPRAGTRVRVPTRRDVQDRSLVREALEIQAARLFAERATAAEKKELRQMGRRMDQLYAACEENMDDRDFLFSANAFHMKLHLRIADGARCPALHEAIEKEQVLIFNWLYETVAERHKLGSDFHARLTDALATGTVTQAENAMRHHIRFGLEDILSKLPHAATPPAIWRHRRSSKTAT